MTKEEIYDSEISPLMARIFEICKANKIAMIASFNTSSDAFRTSALLADDYEPPSLLLQALKLVFPEWRQFLSQ